MSSQQFQDFLRQPQTVSNTTNSVINDGTWTGTFGKSARLLTTDRSAITATIGPVISNLAITTTGPITGTATIAYLFAANSGTPLAISGPTNLRVNSSSSFQPIIVNSVTLLINGIFIGNAPFVAGFGYVIPINSSVTAQTMSIIFNISASLATTQNIFRIVIDPISGPTGSGGFSGFSSICGY